MPTIARGQPNTPSLINFFVTLSGSAFDPFAVRFRVLDVTGGLPGVQVYPVAAGTYEDIAGTPGNFQPGGYYAYNVADGNGWTPELSSNLGTHRVEWQWEDTNGSFTQTKVEDFTIVESSSSGDPLYCSVASLRDLGMTDPPWTDAELEASIRLWQGFIERATNQWFYPKELELRVDGTDSDALHFGVPIISVEELRINREESATEPDYYEVYSDSPYPRDKKNPRIKLIDQFNGQRDIFTAPDRYGRRMFRKGRKNQYIKGVFGYTEEDGSVPGLICRAVQLLVIEKLSNPPIPRDDIPFTPATSGIITEEWTDGHKIKRAQAGGTVKPKAPGLNGITDNQEVLDIIKLYKAPIGVATPAHPSYR